MSAVKDVSGQDDGLAWASKQPFLIVLGVGLLFFSVIDA